MYHMQQLDRPPLGPGKEDWDPGMSNPMDMQFSIIDFQTQSVGLQSMGMQTSDVCLVEMLRMEYMVLTEPQFDIELFFDLERWSTKWEW